MRTKPQPITDLLRTSRPLTPREFTLLREYTAARKKLPEVTQQHIPSLTAGANLPDADAFEWEAEER